VIGDLSDGPISATASLITDAALAESSAKLVPPGALLIAMYGSIGKLAITQVEMATNQAIAFAIPDPGTLDTRFLFHYLMSQREALTRAGKGATQQNISQTILRSWPVPVAPLGEQRRIVEVLESHLSRLDAALTSLKLARARCASLGAAVLESDERIKSSPRRLLAELLEAPLANGRSVKDAVAGFPVLRLTSLRNGRVDLSQRKIGAWSADEAARFLVRHGDFLVARGNGSLHLVGRGGLVVDEPDAVAFPDTLIRIRPNLEMIDPYYLAMAWDLQEVRTKIESAARTTAGIYKVNQRDLEGLMLPVPTLAEQLALSELVSQLRSALSRIDATMIAMSCRADALRRSLLAAAFAGQFTSSTPGEEQTRV
jgi:type I restriction enzyme S subunit